MSDIICVCLLVPSAVCRHHCHHHFIHLLFILQRIYTKIHTWWMYCHFPLSFFFLSPVLSIISSFHTVCAINHCLLLFFWVILILLLFITFLCHFYLTPISHLHFYPLYSSFLYSVFNMVCEVEVHPSFRGWNSLPAVVLNAAWEVGLMHVH